MASGFGGHHEVLCTRGSYNIVTHHTPSRRPGHLDEDAELSWRSDFELKQSVLEQMTRHHEDACLKPVKVGGFTLSL